MEKKEKVIQIEKPNIREFHIGVRSYPGSSLIMNNFSDAAKTQIQNKQLKKAVTFKQAKDPDKVFQDSLIKHNGDLALKSIWFKTAMVGAANIAEMKMTDARKAFFVIGEYIPFTKNSKPKMKEDFLPLKRAGRDWRIRAEIDTWEAKVPIRYNGNWWSEEQIINLISLAGFHCGVGDNRPNSPKCCGSHGMFEVVGK
jgi:hypothetical protein